MPRLCALGVLVYLLADYCDPFMPGVFFFDSASLTIHSVDAKAERPTTVELGPLPAQPSRAPSPPPRPRRIARTPVRSVLQHHALPTRDRAAPPSAGGDDTEDH